MAAKKRFNIWIALGLRFLLYSFICYLPVQYLADSNSKRFPEWVLYAGNALAIGWFCLFVVGIALCAYGLYTFDRTRERGRWGAIVITGFAGLLLLSLIVLIIGVLVTK